MFDFKIIRSNVHIVPCKYKHFLDENRYPDELMPDLLHMPQVSKRKQMKESPELELSNFYTDYCKLLKFIVYWEQDGAFTIH